MKVGEGGWEKRKSSCAVTFSDAAKISESDMVRISGMHGCRQNESGKRDFAASDGFPLGRLFLTVAGFLRM